MNAEESNASNDTEIAQLEELYEQTCNVFALLVQKEN
jgi:hypothetical protein